MPPDAKVTSGILWLGALTFALADGLFVLALARMVRPEVVRRSKWQLVSVTGVFFTALWGLLASWLYWGSVYHHFFPERIRWVLPPAIGLLFATASLVSWWLSSLLPGNATAWYCLLGGAWGMVSHLWALHRGLMEKPPMLQGASPVAAVVIAAFEFIFYWCVCLSLAALLDRLRDGGKPAGADGPP